MYSQIKYDDDDDDDDDNDDDQHHQHHHVNTQQLSKTHMHNNFT